MSYASGGEPEDSTAVVSKRPLWTMLAALILGACGIGLFFLPVDGVKFWTFDYLLFLATLAIVPMALFAKKGRLLRAVLLVESLAYFGFLQAACPRPTGALELAALHVFDDTPIVMHLLKVGILVLGGIMFSRYFCGWICPKGIIQEYIYRPSVGVKVPEKLDRVLKYGKYLSLVVLVAAPLIWHFRFFREWGGPFKVIFNLDGSTFLIIYLSVVLVSSVFISRAFCRYLCPIGGLLGLLALVSHVRMRIKQDSCHACGKCEVACQVDAIVFEKGKGVTIDRAECIMCRECETACKWDCLEYSSSKKSRVNKSHEHIISTSEH